MIGFLIWLIACGNAVTDQAESSSKGQSKGRNPASRPGPDRPFQGARPRHIETPIASPLSSLNDKVLTPSTPEVHLKEPPLNAQPSETGVCAGCDIILITVCSLRKDHVSAFSEAALMRARNDSGSNSTPNPQLMAAANRERSQLKTNFIDSLAMGGNGFRFTNTYSASNFTLAGLTAVLTGRYGSSTGVTGWDKGLTKDIRTLPEILGLYGYNTAGFTIDAASGFRPDYGLDRGFQRLEIWPPFPGTPDGRNVKGARVRGAAAKPFYDWLVKQEKDKPVFAMLHTRTAHYPFVVDSSLNQSDSTGISQLLWNAGLGFGDKTKKNLPGSKGGQVTKGVEPVKTDPLHSKVRELGDKAIDVWKARYKEAVIRMDEDVRVVLEAIEARGRKDKTLVFLIADHGESLNEHAELLHGQSFFNSVINVPFVMSVPKGAGSEDWLPGSDVIDALSSQVDLMPTILDFVGATIPANIDGRSLLPILKGEKTQVHEMVLSEGGVTRHDSSNPPGAVISPPWSLLTQPLGCGGGNMGNVGQELPTCLFDKRSDPNQNKNVAASHPDVVLELSSKWKSYREEREGKSRRLKLSDEFIKELRATGYDFH